MCLQKILSQQKMFRETITSQDNTLSWEGNEDIVAGIYAGYLLGNGFDVSLKYHINNPIRIDGIRQDLTIPLMKGFLEHYQVPSCESQQVISQVETGFYHNAIKVKQGCRYDLGIPPRFPSDRMFKQVTLGFVEAMIDAMLAFGSHHIQIIIFTLDANGILTKETIPINSF